jgi:hypothetical protein
VQRCTLLPVVGSSTSGVAAGKRRLGVGADRGLSEEGAGILLLEGAVGSTLLAVGV